MSVLPKALKSLIEQFANLPGVGTRTAERYAYSVVKSSPQKAKKLSEALSGLHDNIDQCPVTFAYIEAGQKYSPLYDDPSRDKTTIAIVEDPLDIVPIEKTGQYSGTYHCLGGLLSPMQGFDEQSLNLGTLTKRIEDDKVQEVIIALSASVEGETTALFITNALQNKVKITKLARGIPAGVDIEYTDQTTLTQALEQRREA